MKTLLLCFPLLWLAPLPLRSAEPAAPARPAPAEVKPVTIDVRTQAEWDAGHIEGALHLPVDVIGERIAAAVPDKTTPVVLYCKAGVRAGKAKGVLEKLGYTRVENAGGYEDLKKKRAAPAQP
jgi:phage shock protein E